MKQAAPAVLKLFGVGPETMGASRSYPISTTRAHVGGLSGT